MRSHARDGRLRISSGTLELDVAVELLEAHVAPNIGSGRSEETTKRAWKGTAHTMALDSGDSGRDRRRAAASP
jgi:hypothetical protein